MFSGRTGRDVVGNTPPTEVALFKHARKVRAQRPRPLQCGKCGGYGHCNARCTSSPRCLRCEGIMLERTARPPVLSASTAMAPTSPPNPAVLAGNTKERCWKLWPARTRPFLAVRQRDSSRITRTRLLAPLLPPSHRRCSRVVQRLLPHPIPCTRQRGTQGCVPGALAAAVQALIRTLPQDGPVFQLCSAALAAHAALGQHG